jgi:6-phospho-beta-glucosidase
VPVAQPRLAPELLGLVQHVAGYERLAAAASTTGDRETARLALLSHPLVREYRLAESMLDRLLVADAPANLGAGR